MIGHKDEPMIRRHRAKCVPTAIQSVTKLNVSREVNRWMDGMNEKERGRKGFSKDDNMDGFPCRTGYGLVSIAGKKRCTR
mmetsp:Transcript_17269/g.31889  ORF Transcript_17269/g.31889 Transcript_17269/m.31889 type:complete len:80 (+) Transcript_17269:474-713(+)